MNKSGQGEIQFQSNLYTSRNPTRRWLHNARRTWIVDTITPLIGEAAVLEIGIGCGTYTRWMSTRARQIHSIDINPGFVDAVRDLANVDARLCSIYDMQYEDAFDLVLCSEVIEHLDNTSAALSTIYRALRPGGHLLLTTPNRYSTMELFARLLQFRPIASIARIVYREPVAELGHINLMTRKELQNQMLATGFQIVCHSNAGLYLPILAELFGNAGRALAEQLAYRVSKSTILSGCLWTQCWLVKKPIT